MLRQLGLPIILFAEDQAFRRERLKLEIVNYTMREMQLPVFTSLESSEESDEQNEVFYTEGSQELRSCRLNILKNSIEKAQYRLSQPKHEIDLEDVVNKIGNFVVTES